MMRRLPLLIIALAALFIDPSQSPAENRALVVSEVTDGDTLSLADGTVVRLAGILAPKDGEPLATMARAALEELALGRALAPLEEPPVRDRHGRRLAHLRRADGLWLQAALVERGMARVRTLPDSRAFAAELLAAEARARAAGRGLWAEPGYRPLAADAAAGREGVFHLVEGVVLAVVERKGRTYVNFGADWRTDFTIAIDSGARRLFRQARVDPAGWTGRKVRVRGWLKEFNGPMIEATHPEQIEVLE